MRIRSGLPTGVSALLFDEARERRALETRCVSTLEEQGYGEVLLPILDYYEPYAPLLDPRGRDRLYRFVDRDGELLALRSDFTPMLARILAPRLGALEMPLRLFYRGDVIRYHDAGPGRARESFQLGAERLGESGPEVDAEVLALFVDVLRAATSTSEPPLEGLKIVLGHAGALDELLLEGRSPEEARNLARSMVLRDRAALRSDRRLFEILEGGEPARDADLLGGAGRLEALRGIVAAVEERASALGVEVRIDLAEFATASMDPALLAPGETPSYYDGFLFRAFGAGGPSLALGGRYDKLFASLGGHLPAVGFTVALDSLLGVDG